jgi:hypothetical protein
MSAFAASIDAIFADPNMAVDAWHRGGGGTFTECRVSVKAPDELTSFGQSRFVTETVILSVRVSEIAQPGIGDDFLVDGVTYEVIAEPRRDGLRLVWRCEARIQ